MFGPDFGAHLREYRPDHQSDQLPSVLQGLVPRHEGAPLHDRGLLPKQLSQQHPVQLLPRSHPGADLHHLGRGVLSQPLLQRSTEMFFVCLFFVFFKPMTNVVTFLVSVHNVPPPPVTLPGMWRRRNSEEAPGGYPAVSATTK